MTQTLNFAEINPNIECMDGVVIVGVFQGHPYFLRPSPLFSDITARGIDRIATSQKFTGNAGQVLEVTKAGKSERMVFVGLGERTTALVAQIKAARTVQDLGGTFQRVIDEAPQGSLRIFITGQDLRLLSTIRAR